MVNRILDITRLRVISVEVKIRSLNFANFCLLAQR